MLDDVWLQGEESDVVLDLLFELDTLVDWVCVVKPQNEGTTVGLGHALASQGALCVADVEEAAWFGSKPGLDV